MKRSNRLSLGPVIAAGVTVLVIYVVGSILFHITKGLIEVIVPVLAAGFAVQALSSAPRSQRLPRWVPLAVGVLVFAGVLAAERALF